METIQINANTREISTKSHLSALRKSGRIPATLYGMNETTESIDISENEFKKITRQVRANAIIALDFGSAKKTALVKEIVIHPVQMHRIMHVDFQKVDEDTPVTVDVFFKHNGIPEGVKKDGGTFSVMKRTIKIRCKAKDIPPVFEQDISNLAIETIICAKDISYPNAVIVTPGKTALYGVTSGRTGVAEEVKPAEAAPAAAEAAGEGEKPADAKGKPEAAKS